MQGFTVLFLFLHSDPLKRFSGNQWQGQPAKGLHTRPENHFKGSEWYDLFIASGQKQGLIIYYFHLYDLGHQWGIFTDLS